MNPLPLLRRTSVRSLLALAISAAFTQTSQAQDNVLILGSSLLQGNHPAHEWFADIVEESGRPRPNVVTSYGPDRDTSDHVASIGIIQSAIPAGESWKAMVVQGMSVETTFLFGYDPTTFLSNMNTLAAALYGHSPQALFVGHETGVSHPDHPTRYPAWFANAAEWLMFQQRAYAAARGQIDANNPGAMPSAIARQGTCFANSAGYDITLYRQDLHHFRNRGQIVCALLWYQEIYGGQLCDLDVDFASSTALANHLNQISMSEDVWLRLVSYCDRVQPRAERELPGSDDDFQLRVAIGAGLTNLCTRHSASVNDVFHVELVSPLGANTAASAILLMEVLPQGTLPNFGSIPGLWLDRTAAQVIFSTPDLTSATYFQSLPPALAGQTVWLQALSNGPVRPGYDYALSDARTIDVN